MTGVDKFGIHVRVQRFERIMRCLNGNHATEQQDMASPASRQSLATCRQVLMALAHKAGRTQQEIAEIFSTTQPRVSETLAGFSLDDVIARIQQAEAEHN